MSLTICSKQASTVSLPCYLGFTNIAIWPVAQSVSKVKSNFKFQKCLLTKGTSYYGLLDVMMISPSLTGQMVEVPYYPGHCYAAFKGNSSTQVFLTFNISIYQCFFYRFKVLLSTEKDLTLCFIIFAAFMSLTSRYYFEILW